MKNRIALVFFGFLSLSTRCYANDVIVVFYDNQFPIKALEGELATNVLIDAALGAAYNIDEKDNATKRINQAVGKIVKSHGLLPSSKKTIEEIYKAAFSELINNDALWLPIYRSLESGGKALSLMLTHNIKKVPAFVFNGQAIIYGVNSIKQAQQLFNDDQNTAKPKEQRP